MGWALATRELTFESSGRTVVIREAPNAYAAFGAPDLAQHLDAFLEGTVADPDVAVLLMEGIARAQMVRPRIADPDEQLPADQDPEDPEVVPFAALYTTEVNELVAIWKESVDRGLRFRDDADGASAGGGGEDVGDAPKRPARARKRKP